MTISDARLVDVAKELGPMLLQAGEEAERQRRLPRRALDLLAEAGLQRMFLPRSLGGLEVDPITCALVVEEVAPIRHRRSLGTPVELRSLLGRPAP